MNVCKTPRAELGVLHGRSILDQSDVSFFAPLKRRQLTFRSNRQPLSHLHQQHQ